MAVKQDFPEIKLCSDCHERLKKPMKLVEVKTPYGAWTVIKCDHCAKRKQVRFYLRSADLPSGQNVAKE